MSNDEDILQAFEKQKTLLNDYKQIMSGLGETLVVAELETVFSELNAIQKRHFRQLEALKSMPEPELGGEDVTEELFQKALENMPEDQSDSSDDEDDDQDTHTQEESLLGDRSFVLSQVSGIPIDPITKSNIMEPGRNTVCNHVYEYKIIQEYVLQRQAKGRRKRKNVKCPHIGCTNYKVELEHIVLDAELRNRIIAMMNTEEVDPNVSVVDLL